MEDFNIEDYKDFEKVTLADIDVARRNMESMIFEAGKKGDFKTAWHYTKMYFQLSRLLIKRLLMLQRKEEVNNIYQQLLLIFFIC